MHKLITLIYLIGVIASHYLIRAITKEKYDNWDWSDIKISLFISFLGSWLAFVIVLSFDGIHVLPSMKFPKCKPPRWLAILPVIFLASCTDEREYQRMKTVEEVVDSLNNNYPKEDNRYDSSLHIVIAGMKQEATLMHLENDTWYVSTQIWTGSKTKMYTLEDNIVHFVPKHKVKSTLRTDSIANL